jgi:hypothetical protein
MEQYMDETHIGKVAIMADHSALGISSLQHIVSPKESE